MLSLFKELQTRNIHLSNKATQQRQSDKWLPCTAVKKVNILRVTEEPRFVS